MDGPRLRQQAGLSFYVGETAIPAGAWGSVFPPGQELRTTGRAVEAGRAQAGTGRALLLRRKDTRTEGIRVQSVALP